MFTIAFAGLAAVCFTLNKVSGYYCKKKKETLLSEIENLKTSMCRLKEGISSPKNYSQEMELQTNELNTLSEQVQYLTDRLQKEEQKTEKLEQQCERERNSYNDYYKQKMEFAHKKFKADHQLHEHLKEQEKLEHGLQNLKKEVDAYKTAITELQTQFNDLNRKYFEDLAEEKARTAQLSKSLCLLDSRAWHMTQK